MAAARLTLASCALLTMIACRGNEQSDAPKPNDPSTGEPGVDTVTPKAPPPGTATGNPAPINNDESVNTNDPAKAQGAGASTGAASATTR